MPPLPVSTTVGTFATLGPLAVVALSTWTGLHTPLTGWLMLTGWVNLIFLVTVMPERITVARTPVWRLVQRGIYHLTRVSAWSGLALTGLIALGLILQFAPWLLLLMIIWLFLPKHSTLHCFRRVR